MGLYYAFINLIFFLRFYQHEIKHYNSIRSKSKALISDGILVKKIDNTFRFLPIHWQLQHLVTTAAAFRCCTEFFEFYIQLDISKKSHDSLENTTDGLHFSKVIKLPALSFKLKIDSTTGPFLEINSYRPENLWSINTKYLRHITQPNSSNVSSQKQLNFVIYSLK